MRENNLNPNNLLQVAGGCFCVVSALLPAETTDTVVSVRATSIPHVESTDTVVSTARRAFYSLSQQILSLQSARQASDD